MRTLTLLGLTLSLTVMAQQAEYRITPSNEDIKTELKSIEEAERTFIPTPKAESQADNLGKIGLKDAFGNKVKLGIGRTIVIEYWTAGNLKDNQYWNKMRELERTMAGEDVQFISINFDRVMGGREQIAEAKRILADMQAPKMLYFDTMDSLPDYFYLPGPVSYMLIDHRGQYTHAGRGDDPETAKLFEEHLPNALRYQKSAKQSGGGQFTLQPNQD